MPLTAHKFSCSARAGEVANVHPSEPTDAAVRKYERLASRYDTRWSGYIEATVRETLTRLHIGDEDRVLDVGCGTGALLHRLATAHPQARLFGIDPTPAMLAIARQRLPPTVETQKGRIEAIPFPDEFFDAVTCCNVFHYLHEPLAAFREMTRVLRPGGQLVITDWCGDYLTCRLYDWYLRRYSPAHVKVYRAHDWLTLLREASQADAKIDPYKISWFWGLMTATSVKRVQPA